MNGVRIAIVDPQNEDKWIARWVIEFEEDIDIKQLELCISEAILKYQGISRTTMKKYLSPGAAT